MANGFLKFLIIILIFIILILAAIPYFVFIKPFSTCSTQNNSERIVNNKYGDGYHLNNLTRIITNYVPAWNESSINNESVPLQSSPKRKLEDFEEEFNVTRTTRNSILLNAESLVNNEIDRFQDYFYDHGNALLVIQTSSIFKIPLFSNLMKTQIFMNGSPLEKLSSIAIDCANETAYIYSDSGDRIIRTPYRDEIEEDTFITNLHEPVGISMDWISKNIFLLGKARSTIEVVNFHAKNYKRKILMSDEIYNPKAIVVHPGRGKIFWSDWGQDFNEPKIEWANEDGSDRKIFFRKKNVYPDFLVLDWATDELCWIDRNSSSIHCSPIERTQVRVIAENLTHISGFGITGDSFYWINSNGYEIIKKSKYNERRESILPKNNFLEKHLDSIVVLPEKCPKFENHCQFRNGGCRSDELCLPRGRKNRTCVCPDNSPYPCKSPWIEKFRNVKEEYNENN